MRTNSWSRASVVLGYAAAYSVLFGLLAPYDNLTDIATAFMLKNQLKADAGQVSVFRLLTIAPFYLGFVFGLTRDLWNPLRRRDRGYFLIFGPLSAAVFATLAFAPLSVSGLTVGVLAVSVCASFVNAAFGGLVALVGQEQSMSGRLATVWRLVLLVMNVGGALLGGVVAAHIPARVTFLILAALALGLGAFGLWRPKAVFEGLYERPQARGAGFIDDLKRLVRCRAVYPPVVMMLLFQFAPGGNTPLQYYLTNVLHASDEAYGQYQAIFFASFIPTYLLYGWLCTRVSFEKLVWWAMILTVPQFVPFLFIHSAGAALICAVPIGLMGGLAVLALWDLTIRSCPPGLQGTLMALVLAVDLLSQRASDLLGSWIYTSAPNPTQGFIYCVISITVVYASILLVIPLIPKDIIRSADGEPQPSDAGASPAPA